MIASHTDTSPSGNYCEWRSAGRVGPLARTREGDVIEIAQQPSAECGSAGTETHRPAAGVVALYQCRSVLDPRTVDQQDGTMTDELLKLP